MSQGSQLNIPQIIPQKKWTSVLFGCLPHVKSFCQAFLFPKSPFISAANPWSGLILQLCGTGNLTFLPHLYPSYSSSLSLNRTTHLSSDPHDKRTHTGYFQKEFSKMCWNRDCPYSPAGLAKNRRSFPRKKVIGGIDRGTSRPKVFVFPLTCHPWFHTSLCGFQCECCAGANKRPKQGLT